MHRLSDVTEIGHLHGMLIDGRRHLWIVRVTRDEMFEAVLDGAVVMSRSKPSVADLPASPFNLLWSMLQSGLAIPLSDLILDGKVIRRWGAYDE